MQAFTLLLIGCVMLSDFFIKLLGLPTILRFLPEAMSTVVVVYVLFAGTRDRFHLVAPKYWFVFGAFAVVILCGIINNASGVGPLLSGMRFYLRAVPMFFLPAVFQLTDSQLKQQLKWLLALSLVQVPVALYQRWTIELAGRFSGDDVRGTLLDSGILSLFLICVVLMLTGMLLRRRIGALWYGALCLLLLIPTTINETKVTVFFLPAGLLVTLFFGAEPSKRFKYIGLALAGLVIVGALYVPVYNMTQAHNPYKSERDITNFFTNQKALGKYLSSDVGGVGTTKDVRRGDALAVPLQFLAQDPVRLMFGLGMGAVSPSNFGKNFEGSYYQLFKKFLIISFTFFLLEFGVLGVTLIGVLFWMVFSDTLAVRRQDNTLFGVLATGWIGVVAIFAADTVYTIFHEFASVTYLYWYFSGLICARCVALAYARQELHHSAARPGIAPVV
ncbi:MAG: hypothetical protein QOF32_1821 [Gammaproteobacteria bacterium]|jgi:uncharacterized membrane protein YhaH (DUF805 family)|nr:hypothetical protein [Gammaproteobacteria bacterium]